MELTELEKERVKETYSGVIQRAKDNLIKHKYLSPYALIYTEDPFVGIDIKDIINDANFQSFLIKKINLACKALVDKGHKILCIIMVHEAWVSEVDEQGKIPSMNPSKNPNRREAICVSCSTPEKADTQYFPFVRIGQLIIFSKPMEVPEGQPSSTVFGLDTLYPKDL